MLCSLFRLYIELVEYLFPTLQSRFGFTDGWIFVLARILIWNRGYQIGDSIVSNFGTNGPLILQIINRRWFYLRIDNVARTTDILAILVKTES